MQYVLQYNYRENETLTKYKEGRLIMKIPYCDGYYYEDGIYYRHDDASGLDVMVHEDEAMAHNPSMYLDNWNNAPWYEHNHEEHADALIKRYNQYRDFLDVLEELLEEAKESSNTLAEIEFNNTIASFKNAQTVILKRLGIIL